MSGFLDHLKGIFAAKSQPAIEQYSFIFVYLLGAIQPGEREERYGDPLNTELQLAGLGEVSGGGAGLSGPDTNGHQQVIFAGVDVDATDLDRARALLREHLPELGCPADTRLEYRDGGVAWQDEWSGAAWHLRQPRTPHLGED